MTERCPKCRSLTLLRFTGLKPDGRRDEAYVCPLEPHDCRIKELGAKLAEETAYAERMNAAFKAAHRQAMKNGEARDAALAQVAVLRDIVERQTFVGRKRLTFGEIHAALSATSATAQQYEKQLRERIIAELKANDESV